MPSGIALSEDDEVSQVLYAGGDVLPSSEEQDTLEMLGRSLSTSLGRVRPGCLADMKVAVGVQRVDCGWRRVGLAGREQDAKEFHAASVGWLRSPMAPVPPRCGHDQALLRGFLRGFIVY